MQNHDWKKTKEIFHQTLDLPRNERKNFLANQDDFVRSEVSRLLESHEKIDDFIAEPLAIEIGLNVNSYLGKTIDSYKIIEIIGTGGMGQVFLAEKEGLDKRFAVKIIKRGMDTEAVLMRFVRERQILSRLEHPYIARLLDGGMTADGLPYFVMEYVEGLPLTRFCDEQKFDIKERLKLFRQICSAISYAHQNLIVHRDLKPSNILITNGGNAKLLDFGIAKLLNPNDFEQTATATQGRMFTPEYASPEQINGQPITTASDVYSLGVILYELLGGQRPFQSKSKNYQKIARRILTEEPIRPSAIIKTVGEKRGKGERETRNLPSNISQSQLRGDLDNIILKALRKESERRYQSVQEFSEDCRRYLIGLPVTATADSTYYRLSKFIKRNRIGTMIAAVILLLSGVSIWQGIKANKERQKAEKRLMEIRNVAKSLINETNDSLAKIPGNVTVQKALAEKSVALLDSLAKEETDDAILLSELAESYTKLAGIQLWSFREFDKTIENLEKSVVIYQKILQKNPNDVEIRRKIYTVQMRYIEALHNTNRREEMFKIGTEAVENRQEIVLLESENPSNYANLAAMYGWFGDKNLLFGQKAEAVENYRKGIEIINQAIEKQSTKINSADAKAEFARLYFIKGWLTKGAGESEKAVGIFRKSAEIAKQVFAENASIVGNFRRVIGSYEEIAGIYEKQNDFQMAFEAYLWALNLTNEGLKKSEIPEYGILLYSKCFYTVFAGKMSAKLKNKEARKYFTDGEMACRQNIAQDENDAGNIFESLPYFYEIADFYAASGEKEKAVNQLLELSKKLHIVLDKNQSDLTAAFSLAETFEKIGDISNDEKSREFYEKSVKIWREHSANNSLVPEEIEKMNQAISKLEK